MLYKWQTLFCIQGAENCNGQLFLMLSLARQPLLSRVRTRCQAEIQVPISRLTHQSGKREVGAPAAPLIAALLGGWCFSVHARWFMSQNSVCTFRESLSNFNTKGADRCRNCCRTTHATPAGTRLPWEGGGQPLPRTQSCPATLAGKGLPVSAAI